MQKAIKTAVKHIYSEVNGHFEKIFKVSFAEAQTKVKELQLQKKKDAIDKKRQRRERVRQEKIKSNANVWSIWRRSNVSSYFAVICMPENEINNLHLYLCCNLAFI